jgi:hypothetical protein
LSPLEVDKKTSDQEISPIKEVEEVESEDESIKLDWRSRELTDSDYEEEKQASDRECQRPPLPLIKPKAYQTSKKQLPQVQLSLHSFLKDS